MELSHPSTTASRETRGPSRRSCPAVVLGATLAFSGCALAGCTDEPDERISDMPALAAVAPDPIDETADEVTEDVVAPEDDEPDVTVTAGRLPTLQASPGFAPDPTTRRASTSGGSVDLDAFDERCAGYAARAPDLVLNAERPFAELAVMVASSEDTSLMIVGPDGEARCGVDDDGTHPMVRGLFAPGLHRIWVGAAQPGTVVPFVLGFSELESSLPSTLAPSTAAQ